MKYFYPVLLTITVISCKILRKADTCSCSKRTPIPDQSGQGFLLKADNNSWGKRTAGRFKADSDSC